MSLYYNYHFIRQSIISLTGGNGKSDDNLRQAIYQYDTDALGHILTKKSISDILTTCSQVVNAKGNPEKLRIIINSQHDMVNISQLRQIGEEIKKRSIKVINQSPDEKDIDLISLANTLDFYVKSIQGIINLIDDVRNSNSPQQLIEKVLKDESNVEMHKALEVLHKNIKPKNEEGFNQITKHMSIAMTKSLFDKIEVLTPSECRDFLHERETAKKIIQQFIPVGVAVLKEQISKSINSKQF